MKVSSSTLFTLTHTHSFDSVYDSRDGSNQDKGSLFCHSLFNFLIMSWNSWPDLRICLHLVKDCCIIFRNIRKANIFIVKVVAGNRAKRDHPIEHPPSVTVLVLYEGTARVARAGSSIYTCMPQLFSFWVRTVACVKNRRLLWGNLNHNFEN